MSTEIMTTPFDGQLTDFAMEEPDFSKLEGMDASNFTAAQPISNTVSPQELFLDNFTAPSTGATGYLSTPSLIDGTPDLSSYDCSPAFGTMNADQTWPPLFPESSNDDLGFTDEPLFGSTESLELPDLPHKPTTSLVSNTSSSATRPRSSLASPIVDNADFLRRTIGVTSVIKSSRRATKELPPIAVEEEDEKAVKRARNTMAARKSRQKKRDIEDALRIALEDMTAQRDKWRLLAVKHGAPIPDME